MAHSIDRRKLIRTTSAAAATFAAWRAFPGMARQESGGDISIQDLGIQIPEGEQEFNLLDSGDAKRYYWEAFFPAYEEQHPNVTVQYDGLPWNEIEQILPLSVQNGNAPDVFQVPGSIPMGQAVTDGWVAPWDDFIPNIEEWRAAFPAGTFLPGLTDFNGQTYVAPLSSNRRYSTMVLYNQQYMDEAGLDPASEPFTWSTFREAARTLTEQGGGQYYGLIMGGNQVGRYQEIVRNLARMAGASALDDIDYRTGEYVYTSDEYIAAVELLLAINDDGSIHPSSLSINAPQARAQVPQGAAAMILQGPWNIPVWREENPDFVFNIASTPLPDEGEALPLTVGPNPGNGYNLYAEARAPEVAADVIAQAGTLIGQQAWANYVGVADPVAMPEAAAAVEDDIEQRTYALFEEQVRGGPDPRVRNPEAEAVYLNLRPITPTFGQTVQGLFTGQLQDVRAEMEALQERASANLDDAIARAQADGADVSRDDWVFPNWDPTQNYTAEDYEAL